jgi:hypothetical protein
MIFGFCAISATISPNASPASVTLGVQRYGDAVDCNGTYFYPKTQFHVVDLNVLTV